MFDMLVQNFMQGYNCKCVNPTMPHSTIKPVLGARRCVLDQATRNLHSNLNQFSGVTGQSQQIIHLCLFCFVVYWAGDYYISIILRK